MSAMQWYAAAILGVSVVTAAFSYTLIGKVREADIVASSVLQVVLIAVLCGRILEWW